MYTGKKTSNFLPSQYIRAFEEHQEHQHLVVLVCADWKTPSQPVSTVPSWFLTHG